MLNGIIVINKGQKFTSHDVVAKMRGIAGQKKVGHTGTLDPDATGVLPICFGKATKVSELLTNKTKEYRTTLLLGKESDTQDIWGKIEKEEKVAVSIEQVKEVIFSFQGISMQIPPMYSALKVQGKKLYEFAREGIEIERKPRKIEVSFIEIESIALPEITFRVVCSKGTYIRTLCYDIGKKLGCGGLMKALERTRVGDFTLEQAYSLEQIQDLKDHNKLQDALISVDSLFIHLKKIHVKEEAKKWLDNGNILRPVQTKEYEDRKLNNIFENGEEVCVYNHINEFCAIYIVDLGREIFISKKMFI